MLIKIFVQDNCPNCPLAKQLGENLSRDGLNVEFFNIRTPDGLAESLIFDVLSTPSTIILKDNNVLSSFLGKTPSIEEVKKWL